MIKCVMLHLEILPGGLSVPAPKSVHAYNIAFGGLLEYLKRNSPQVWDVHSSKDLLFKVSNGKFTNFNNF